MTIQLSIVLGKTDGLALHLRIQVRDGLQQLPADDEDPSITFVGQKPHPHTKRIGVEDLLQLLGHLGDELSPAPGTPVQNHVVLVHGGEVYPEGHVVGPQLYARPEGLQDAPAGVVLLVVAEDEGVGQTATNGNTGGEGIV